MAHPRLMCDTKKRVALMMFLEGYQNKQVAEVLGFTSEQIRLWKQKQKDLVLPKKKRDQVSPDRMVLVFNYANLERIKGQTQVLQPLFG